DGDTTVSPYGVALLQSNPIVGVVGRHVGEDHLIPDLETGQHFDRVHGALPELHLHALGVHAVRSDLEQADGALILTEGRAAHEDDVVQALEFDRAVHAQVRHGAFRQLAAQRHVDGARAVDHRRIDARDAPFDDAVARIDFSFLSQLDV